jgi:MYXO-CTERM domain-containing protein
VTPFSQEPPSYFAKGPNHVAARSSWNSDAVWATFVSGQYIDAPDSGEQYFNQGAIAVVQGDQPILANATGWLPQAAGDQGEQLVYDDTWTNRTRLLDNTFYVEGATQGGGAPGDASTHIENYEDLGVVVHARGRAIEQMYAPSSAVTQFTREFAYVRPALVVVYDRTTVPNAGTDQWLAWHTAVSPTPVTLPDDTEQRYDLGASGAVIGSVRALLPRSVKASTTSLLGGAAFRLELHTSAASQDWLTTVSVGANVPDQRRLSQADGNVTSGSITGVHVLGSRNQVVLFSTDHAARTPTASADYAVAQTAISDHVVFDVEPSTKYDVTATGANGKLTIHLAAGTAASPSAAGTLVFTVAMDGTVSFPPPPSIDAGAPNGSGSAGPGGGGAGDGPGNVGPAPPGGSSGCGCRSAVAVASPAWPVLTAVAALIVVRRRRQRRQDATAAWGSTTS